MIPLSPSLLIAAANAFVGMDADSVALRVLREVWVPDDAAPAPGWHTAFVNHVGYWAHWHHQGRRSSWPLPATACPNELAQFAATTGALREDPEPGDVFILWSPGRNAFLRSGIVVKVGKPRTDAEALGFRQCVTIEGDSDVTMRGVGGTVLRHKRRLSKERGDRFVRWTALDLRAMAASEASRSVRTRLRRAA